MGALQDVAEEFKKASPGGKALAVVALIAVAGAGLYIAHVNGSSGSSTSGSLLPVNVGSDSGTSTSTTSSQQASSALSSLVIRNKVTTPNTWDSVNPGIPIRSQATTGGVGETILGYLPWGSSFTPSGNAVTGGYNLPNNTGSDVWIPYNGGYISSFDVIDGPNVVNLPKLSGSISASRNPISA
jgi:hypothetical protein